MKTVLLSLKKEFNRENLMAITSCLIISITIYCIMKIMNYNALFLS